MGSQVSHKCPHPRSLWCKRSTPKGLDHWDFYFILSPLGRRVAVEALQPVRSTFGRRNTQDFGRKRPFCPKMAKRATFRLAPEKEQKGDYGSTCCTHVNATKIRFFDKGSCENFGFKVSHTQKNRNGERSQIIQTHK